MSIFAIKTKETPEAKKVVKELNEKLNDNNILKNPYKGFINTLGEGEDFLILAFLDSSGFFNPKYYTLIIAFIISIFTGFKLSLFHLILIPFLLLNFLHTKYSAYLSFRYTLTKYNHKERMSLLGDQELLLRLARWDKEK